MHPILFEFGPLTVYSYGVCVAAAFIVVSYLFTRDSGEYSISKAVLWDLAFWILVAGIIGARSLHVLLNIKYYKTVPLEIFMLNKGGLAVQGGIIFATIGGILFLIKKRLPVWKIGDFIMQYVPLGQSIGRIGCLLNGCCYGKNGIMSQIYSATGLLCIYMLLRIIYVKRRTRFNGQVFMLYFILYSIFRFFMDFSRGDLQAVWFGLTASQITGALIFITASLIYYGKYRFSSRG